MFLRGCNFVILAGTVNDSSCFTEKKTQLANSELIYQEHIIRISITWCNCIGLAYSLPEQLTTE